VLPGFKWLAFVLLLSSSPPPASFGDAPPPVNEGGTALPLRLVGSVDPLAACGPYRALACSLSPDDLAAFTTSVVTCTLPAGVGGPSFEILLDSFWVPLPGGYSPPTVTSVSPPRIAITGGAILVAGMNFGDPACVDPARPFHVSLLLPRDPTLVEYSTELGRYVEAGPTRTPVACEVTSWSSTLIQCQAPEGLGEAVSLMVTAGGQTNTTVGLIGYAAPVLESVRALDPLDTVGGGRVAIRGSGFPLPPWNVTVVWGTAGLCSVLPSSRLSGYLECRAPRGAGTVGCRLIAPLLTASNPVQVSYAPPVVLSVAPPAESRPIQGGFVIQIVGRNFFPGATVTIGAQACTSVSITDEAMTSLSCVSPSGPGVGAVLLTVQVASQVVSVPYSYRAPNATSVSPNFVAADVTIPIEVGHHHARVLATSLFVRRL
jgi:hypothetical protein